MKISGIVKEIQMLRSKPRMNAQMLLFSKGNSIIFFHVHPSKAHSGSVKDNISPWLLQVGHMRRELQKYLVFF